MKYEVKNNQLLCDGKVVKPEFGNVEQINAIKKAIESYGSGQVKAKITNEEVTQYYGKVKFTCPCCNTVNKWEPWGDEPSEDWEYDASDLCNESVFCTSCGIRFTVNNEESSGSEVLLSYTREKEDTEDPEQFDEFNQPYYA